MHTEAEGRAWHLYPSGHLHDLSAEVSGVDGYPLSSL